MADYRQQPSFPDLFESVIGSPALQRVADEMEGKIDSRICKQDSKVRWDLEFELGTKNVIDMLLEINGRLFYRLRGKPGLYSMVKAPDSAGSVHPNQAHPAPGQWNAGDRSI